MASDALSIGTNFLAQINKSLQQYSPTTLITASIATTLFLQSIRTRYADYKNDTESLGDKAIRYAQSLPYVGTKIQNQINKEVKATIGPLKHEIEYNRKPYWVVGDLPQKGMSAKKILERFEIPNRHYKPGKHSGAVYTDYDADTLDLLKNIWIRTVLTNPMHAEWPLINLMEAEIISICQNLMQGTQGAPGIITHGGTTSILEACKAYVLEARRRGITVPEIIVPASAHIAFDKAAIILNAKLVKVPLDPQTGAADVIATEKMINSNTCLLVGSAPSFSFGIVDPIPSLGALALKYQLPLHVDSCLGGFLTMFAKEAGFEIPPCDFSVPGVTSISVDTHKYGYAPKGSSVVLFRNHGKYHTAHIHLDWTSGMYVTPSIDGSRSGADIAVLNGLLLYFGRDMYVKETKKTLTLQRELIKAVQQIEGIYVPYQPLLSVVGFKTTSDLNVLLVTDQLQQKGWSVNILQTSDQKPDGFHFCLTSVHANQKEFLTCFITDLKAAVNYVKKNPNENPKGMAKVYGKLEKGVPSFVQEIIGKNYLRALNTLPQVEIPEIGYRP